MSEPNDNIWDWAGTHRLNIYARPELFISVRRGPFGAFSW